MDDLNLYGIKIKDEKKLKCLNENKDKKQIMNAINKIEKYANNKNEIMEKAKTVFIKTVKGTNKTNINHTSSYILKLSTKLESSIFIGEQILSIASSTKDQSMIKSLSKGFKKNLSIVKSMYQKIKMYKSKVLTIIKAEKIEHGKNVISDYISFHKQSIAKANALIKNYKNSRKTLRESFEIEIIDGNFLC